MRDTRYLKRRVGKGRSGERWYVRVPIPKDLQGRFGRASAIERALNTSDLQEARRRRHAVIAEIFEDFERARRGGLSSADIEAEARRFLRENLETIRDRPGDIFEPVVLEDGSDHGPGGVAALWHLQDALQDRDWGPVQNEAERIIKQRGIEPSGAQWDELCHALLNAQIEALRAALTRHRGEIPELPAVLNSNAIDPVTFEIPSPTRTMPRSGTAITVSEAAERFLSDRMRDPDARWTRQTEAQYRTSCRLFTDYVQDAPLDAVTREDAAGFLTTLGRLHRDYGRSSKSKGLRLDQLLELYGGEPGLSNATLNRHSRALNGLFKWASQAGLHDGTNPFTGQQRSPGRRSRTGWQPFTVDELNALFGHPILLETGLEERLYPRKHSPQTALMWVPTIALFSGMREDEICGLRVTDVREEDGVLYFNVVEHEGRSVKSEAAIRRVPVHSRLIEVGFGEYFNHVCKGGQTYLFPGLRAGGPDGKRNWYFSRAFTAYRRRVGVTRQRVSFHSFRKNVVEALERARAHQSEVAQIIGHERGFTFSAYSPLGLDLPGLMRVVEKIEFRGLEIAQLLRHRSRAESRRKNA